MKLSNPHKSHLPRKSAILACGNLTNLPSAAGAGTFLVAVVRFSHRDILTRAHTPSLTENEVNGKIVVNTIGAIGHQSEIRRLGQERPLIGCHRKQHASLNEERGGRGR